ncbi:GNAT family N-acetyltransferase [Sphingoaurantiacus capsulatus]|uniref:GNAT family N-acetyltransferase n=1 Tax=Sphingoaurantiacus capsulatus TaxID=1771310 RepID=A0ABV7X758_9SPHN
MEGLRHKLGILGAPELTGRVVRLDYLAEHHCEPLRAACAADPDIWDIYPYSMLGEAFDAWWAATPQRHVLVAIHGGEVVGMTSFYDVSDAKNSAAIGGTYFRPDVRGTGVNGEVKRLMLSAAFGAGARRVEFHVDAINGRSRRAVEKLGAQLDGILRQDRTTWTGRVRDTCVYSILKEEWPAVRAILES